MHIHVRIINSTAIRIAWGAPRFEEEDKRGIIRAFMVETKGLGKDGKPTGFMSRSRIPVQLGTKLTVAGLEPSTNYSVSIWGVTRRSEGVKSVPIHVKTFRSGTKPFPF